MKKRALAFKVLILLIYFEFFLLISYENVIMYFKTPWNSSSLRKNHDSQQLNIISSII